MQTYTETKMLHEMDYIAQQNESIIAWLSAFFQRAIEMNVSDIHFEPNLETNVVRFRKDGLLSVETHLTREKAAMVISRIKILAGIDIAEKRLPQDGHIKIEANLTANIRVSTCPTIYGEKIVLRILNTINNGFAIANLGLNEKQLNCFVKELNKPNGLILITGPTGSGKSTTLYAALNQLNKDKKNIVSIEDPVECEIEGINQINIQPKIGLTFAALLRAVLRQDPDIIMLGEIRDEETAKICLQAAQTGHLVISTLHTKGTLASIDRLISLGITRYDLTNTLNLIIAQRLIRKKCSACINSEKIITETCATCTKGSSGRIAIFETLPMSGKLSNDINANYPTAIIKSQLKKSGHYSLYDIGFTKFKEGLITKEDLFQVIGANEN